MSAARLGVRLCAALANSAQRGAWRGVRRGAVWRRVAGGVALMAMAPPVSLLAATDALYDTCQYDALHARLLPYAQEADPHLLWRLARACYRRGKAAEGTAREEHYREGLAFARRALELDDQLSAAHKWMAVLLNEVAQLEGSKQRILQSFVMRTHMEHATRLAPQDGTCWHILGMWHYNIATIPWYQRKAAAVLFASPPESSIQQALDTFLHAEEVQPNFYSLNLVMIGRCYLALGAPEEAKPYLQRARDYTREHLTGDDAEAKAQAEQLLKGL